MADLRVSTLWQPWADLIISGTKDVENRTKPFPSTIGLPTRIGIHAGQQWDDAWRLTPGGAVEHPHLGVHRTFPGGRFAAGLLLGTVEVTGCHHARDCFEYIRLSFGAHDSYCSRWAEPDAWHWTLTDPQPLDVPVPMRGMLGLWRLAQEAAHV